MYRVTMTCTVRGVHNPNEDIVWECNSWTAVTLRVMQDLVMTSSDEFTLSVMDKWLTGHDGEGKFSIEENDGPVVWRWDYTPI